MDRAQIIDELREIAPKTKSLPKIVQTTRVYERMRDPALLRLYFSAKTQHMISGKEIFGATPPDIFVGRMGYPKVFVGPLVPPVEGDTSILATPELWPGKSIQEIVEMRAQLVRGMHNVAVKDARPGRPIEIKAPRKITEATQEIALAKRPAEIEVRLSKRPYWRLKWDDHVQPFGPSAPLKDVRVGTMRTDHKIEKVHSDTDLKARSAMIELYQKDVLVSKIQRSLSAGLIGMPQDRKFVPTRWSITAVDDTLGKWLLEDVKHNPIIDEFRVYEINALDNQWEIILMPRVWGYELMEAWWPGTIWNADSPNIAMYSSAEDFHGRKTYAEIGGCYYSARLAIAEKLHAEGKQAAAIVLRESHPGYIMPVGVWNVREHVRLALKTEPLIYSSLEGALQRATSQLEIPLKHWVQNSKFLKNIFIQRRLSDFASAKREIRIKA